MHSSLATPINATAYKLMHDTNEEMRRLVIEASDLADNFSHIQAFANEANLTALKAALEAKRAYENGAAYATLAQEIKSIANESEIISLKICQKIETLTNL